MFDTVNRRSEGVFTHTWDVFKYKRTKRYEKVHKIKLCRSLRKYNYFEVKYNVITI